MKKRLIILCDERRLRAEEVASGTWVEEMNLHVVFIFAIFPPDAPYPMQVFNIDDIPAEDIENLRDKLIKSGVQVLSSSY